MSDLEVMQSVGIMNLIILLRSCQITGALKVHVIAEESQALWLHHWVGWQHHFHLPAIWAKRSLCVLICNEVLVEGQKLRLLLCRQLSSLSTEGTRVWL